MLTGKHVLGSVSSNSRRSSGMPARCHLGHQASKIITAPLHNIGWEFVRAGRESPIDVVAGVVELQPRPDLGSAPRRCRRYCS